MLEKSFLAGMACAAAFAGAQAAPGAPPPDAASPPAHPASQAVRHAPPRLDRSGHRRVGKASVYSGRFDGRRMADGTRMDPQADTAASKTLPLGTTAKVTNLQTGDSAVVTIRDRGPFVKGRIVDLSPAAAAKVGLDRHDGLAKVAVTPIQVPPRADGPPDRAAASDAAPATPRSHSSASPR